MSLARSLTIFALIYFHSSLFAAKAIKVELPRGSCTLALSASQIDAQATMALVYTRLHGILTKKEQESLVHFHQFLLELPQQPNFYRVRSATLLLGAEVMNRLFVELLYFPELLREALWAFDMYKNNKQRLRHFDLWIIRLAGSNSTITELHSYIAELSAARYFLLRYRDAYIDLGVDIELSKGTMSQSEIEKLRRAVRRSIRETPYGNKVTIKYKGTDNKSTDTKDKSNFDFKVVRPDKEEILVEVKQRQVNTSDPTFIRRLLVSASRKAFAMNDRKERSRKEVIVFVNAPDNYTKAGTQFVGKFPIYALFDQTHSNYATYDVVLYQLEALITARNLEDRLQYVNRVRVINTHPGQFSVSQYEYKLDQGWTRVYDDDVKMKDFLLPKVENHHP